MKNLFIVILKYIVPLEKIDTLIEEHRSFLDIYYKNGTFIASGPQVPRNGGVIIAKSNDRSTLEKILKKDPFAINNLAQYHIYEFTPTKYSQEFKPTLQ